MNVNREELRRSPSCGSLGPSQGRAPPPGSEAVVVRVRDGQWSRLAELGLRTRTLVLTNTKPARATGTASSRALPRVGTAGAVGS